MATRVCWLYRSPVGGSEITVTQKAAYGARIQAAANLWLTTVKRMRPDHARGDTARALKQRWQGLASGRRHGAVRGPGVDHNGVDVDDDWAAVDMDRLEMLIRDIKDPVEAHG